jgi:hypothetical protein
LDRVRDLAAELREERNASEHLDDEARETMASLSAKGEERLEHLHTSLHRVLLASETSVISGITDADLNDPDMIAPKATPDHAFDGFDSTRETFDVFNDLEDEYLRLKRENQLDTDDDPAAWLAEES